MASCTSKFIIHALIIELLVKKVTNATSIGYFSKCDGGEDRRCVTHLASVD